MFNWLNELLELRYKYRAKKLELNAQYNPIEVNEVKCESCETLKIQLAIANQEKKVLLDKLINPTPIIERSETEELKPIIPATHRNWNEKRRILEMNDRREAQLRQQKSIEEQLNSTGAKVTNGSKSNTIEELEKELLEVPGTGVS